MKILSTSVGFVGPDGTLLANGSIVLTLPAGMYLILAGGGQVYGNSVILNLDATAKLIGSPQMWCTDELTGNPIFAVQLCASANGLGTVATGHWSIVGTAPIDLSEMANTPSGVSFPSAVLQNPTGPQNINGQTLNLEGAALGFSAASSTSSDSFFSRLAAGVFAVGTAIGNAAGTLRLALLQIGGSSTGLSSPSASTVAVGNGTAGDSSGTLLAAIATIATVTFTTIKQTAGALFRILDNTGGIRFSIPLNGTSQATLNNTLITGGSTYGGTTPGRQRFTSSGTFPIPANVTGVRVIVVGGGGAGCGSTGASSNNGTGGASGSSSIKILTGLTPGNTLTVTIGPGGTGVSGGTGNNGSTSSVASGTQTITTISAPGGGGAANTVQVGLASGAGTGGDDNFGGNNGSIGGGVNQGGAGAGSIFGGGGSPSNSTTGNAGTAPGAGGGGAGGSGGSSVAGGAGAAGIVIFEWTT
ncbi:MAG TPA: hypothetical protein VHA06_06330 [Candidatus Angelobacter sp.]|jgi:hypothetical protein|nr:hypothetical protein [Candidatus Angelobacter sp.]